MSEFVIDNAIAKQCPYYRNYAVTQDGRVYRISTRKEMSQCLNGIPPYLIVRVSENNVARNVKVHRMVALTWVNNDDPENKTQVNHIDGNKLNNVSTNLEWVTRSENQRHALDLGLKQKGEELYNASLNEDQVHQVCRLLSEGTSVNVLAKKFNVSKDIIRKIKAGDTYFHIRSSYNIPHNYKHSFEESVVRWVCERIVSGDSDRGISVSCEDEKLTTIDVKRIRYKIRYKHISDEYF